jgi:uncharacterized RmlC-like cupin family protein
VTTRMLRVEGHTLTERKEARIIRPLELVSHAREAAGIAQLPAITHELVGSEHLGVGMTILEPGVATGPHHHGDRETAVYLVAGRLSLHSGPRLESVAELEVGDLVFLPPYLPHEEMNPSSEEAAVWVVVWNDSLDHIPLLPDADGEYGSDVATG